MALLIIETQAYKIPKLLPPPECQCPSNQCHSVPSQPVPTLLIDSVLEANSQGLLLLPVLFPYCFFVVHIWKIIRYLPLCLWLSSLSWYRTGFYSWVVFPCAAIYKTRTLMTIPLTEKLTNCSYSHLHFCPVIFCNGFYMFLKVISVLSIIMSVILSPCPTFTLCDDPSILVQLISYCEKKNNKNLSPFFHSKIPFSSCYSFLTPGTFPGGKWLIIPTVFRGPFYQAF